MQSNDAGTTALNRRTFLTAGGGALGAVALATVPWGKLAAHAAPRGKRSPNIVLVLADDLGYGELGSYGQTKISTPILDRLADEGVRYTDFYAGAPVCAPARCTLLTGMHTGHASVRNNPDPGEEDKRLRDDEVTFALLLQSMGYRTALLGKWGFSPDHSDHNSHPNSQGFDEFYGYLTHEHAHNYYPTHLWHNRDRVDIPANQNNAKGMYAPDAFADRSLEFIEENKDKPFLLLLSTNVPHFPQHVPDLGSYASETWGEGEKAHAAQITRMDGDVGRIVDKLNVLGIAEDTVFIFMSDNGPHEEGTPSLNPDFFDANGPLRGYKRNLYEGGIRVPAIVWAPGRMGANAGTEVAEPLAMWDLLPTLADLAGAPVPPFVDGGSMRHTFDDSAPTRGGYRKPLPGRTMYWWRVDPWASPRADAVEGGRVRNAAEAVRRGDWKAVRIAPGKDRTVPDSAWDFQLYNLSTDIGEANNVAAQHPDIAATLTGLMRQSWVDPSRQLPAWRPDGLTIEAPTFVPPGSTVQVTVRLANHLKDDFTRVDLELIAPAGWKVTGPRRNRVAVRPGGSKTAVFTVVAGAGSGTQQLRAVATYRMGQRAMETTHSIGVEMPPAPPSATAYLSDMEWISADNGWGPVERDMSNGKNGAGDGPPISLGGTKYTKGLGVHAPSRVKFFLGKAFDRFTTTVGIDDFSANQGPYGSVFCQVWGDGVKLYDSGLVTAAGGSKQVEVNIGAVDMLELVVTDSGNGNSQDHVSWADARVHND